MILASAADLSRLLVERAQRIHHLVEVDITSSKAIPNRKVARTKRP
jgi:hypothetical protein